MCIVTASLTSQFSISLPLLSPPYSLRQSNIEINPVNNPTMTSRCLSKLMSCISLTLNQKLEMINCREEGTLKLR